MSKRDYYEVLSASKSASESEIKKAYRTQAKKFHPDLNPGDKAAEESFKEASEAYEVLKDPQKRATYDQFGHQGLENQGFQGFGSAEDVFSSFGDIFDSFFGFGGQRANQRRGDGPRQGGDTQMAMTITLEEAATGVEKKVKAEINQDCQPCEGKGHEPGHEPVICQTCKGYGQVQQNRGFLSIATPCPTCRGAGKQIDHPCKTCKGQARVTATEEVEVSIPKGVESGMHLRVSGKGHQGSKGGPAGDLYLEIYVKEHDQFVRMDEHLYSSVKVGLAQASLGCFVMVDTLEGKKEIEIPKGSQNAEHVVLKEHGMPVLQSSRRGHHHFEIKVLVPKRLTTKQEELLRAFADESGESVLEPKKSFLDKLKK